MTKGGIITNTYFCFRNVLINISYKMVAVLKHTKMEITSGTINITLTSRIHEENHTHQLQLKVMQANSQAETEGLNTQITDQGNETQLG